MRCFFHGTCSSMTQATTCQDRLHNDLNSARQTVLMELHWWGKIVDFVVNYKVAPKSKPNDQKNRIK